MNKRAALYKNAALYKKAALYKNAALYKKRALYKKEALYKKAARYKKAGTFCRSLMTWLPQSRRALSGFADFAAGRASPDRHSSIDAAMRPHLIATHFGAGVCPAFFFSWDSHCGV